MRLICVLLPPLLALVVIVTPAKLGHHAHGHLARDQAETTTAPPVIPIVRLDSLQRDDGSFQYSYQTANQIQTAVEGYQKRIGGRVGTVMQGQYSYVSPEGHNERVTWIADENGFQAFGDTLGLAALQ